jgi:hypothetical protein
VSGIEDLAEEVGEDLDGGDLERAFNRVVTYAEQALHDQAMVGGVLGSPSLDALCMRLGEALDCTPPPYFDAGLAAHVASAFSFPGALAFITRDLIAAQPMRRHLILLSGLTGDADLDGTRRFFGPEVQVEASPEASAAATARWLAGRLAGAAPGRAFLLAYPHDAAAVAAFRPGLAGEMLFCHHLDHRLMLGVHLPHVRHVDFRHAGFVGCRYGLGIADNLYLPLTAGEAVTAPAPGLPITTATSGRWGEFALSYEVRYAEEVPKWIAVTGGRHLHMGSLPTGIVSVIEANLAFKGIPKNRFVHLSFVESLREALRAEAVGVYIDSFPVGGCRSVVEAMAAGIPVITHHHRTSKLFSNETLAYPGAYSWTDPDDLVAHLGSLTPESLAAERTVVARYYRESHDPGLLAAALAGDAVLGLSPPDRGYAVSTLEAYEHEARSGEPGFNARLGWLVTQALGQDRGLLSAMLYQMQTQDSAGWGDRALSARQNLLVGLTGNEDIAAAYAKADYGELSEHLYRQERRALAGGKPERVAEGEGGAVRVPADRLAQLRQADHDLRWLLRRLGSGPQGWLMRRFGGFSRLEKRYIGKG